MSGYDAMSLGRPIPQPADRGAGPSSVVVPIKTLGHRRRMAGGHPVPAGATGRRPLAERSRSPRDMHGTLEALQVLPPSRDRG